MPEGTGGARRLTRLALVAAAVGALVALVGPAWSAPPDPPAAVPGPVVLVGTGGIRWADVRPDTTPTLDRALRDAGTGTLAVRSIRSSACPLDGWLAISSGRLAAGPAVEHDDNHDNGSNDDANDANDAADDDDDDGACPPMALPVTGAPVPGWAAALERAEDDARGAVLGTFGAALAEGRRSAMALGPGAAVALADVAGVPVGPVGEVPADLDELAADVGAAAGAVDLVVVDVGAIRVDDGPDLSRTDQLQALDARMAAVLRGVPAGATVLLASLADDGSGPHLQLLAATGPAARGSAYDGTVLETQSTRQPGLVQGTDLAPTVLELLGVSSPSVFVGSPVVPGDQATGTTTERRQRLVDRDTAAQLVSGYTVWFFGGLILVELLVYGVVALVRLRRVRTSGPGRTTVLRWLSRAGVVFACVPVATYPANLVPWWRADTPFLVLAATIVAISIGLGALAVLGPWRRHLLGPMGFVGAVTFGLLTADVITGSRLMISSLLGLQPLVAGRFYGLGNVAFAIFGTGALLLATAVADALLRSGRRALAVVVVVAIGALAVVVDGAPGLGSDFGGPLALVPAFALLVVLVGRLRSSWRLGLGVAVGAVVVVVGLALLDWLRPAAERTHLGRFVDAVANGEVGQVVGRKLEQNLDILLGSLVGPLALVGAALLGVAVLRPAAVGLSSVSSAYERAPALRPGLLAVLVLVALGFALNDSGSAVPALAAAITVPLLVAIAATVAAARVEPTSAGQSVGQPAEPER